MDGQQGSDRKTARKDVEELVATPHKPIIVGAGLFKFLRSLAFAASGQFYS